MPIYTLFLGVNYDDYARLVAIGRHQPPTTTTSNIFYYNINWDSLFKNENYNYKKCRVRYQFQVKSVTLTSIANHSGTITTNLISMNKNNSNVSGTPLGLYFHGPLPTFVSGRYTQQSNMAVSMTGTEIEIPKGVSELQINYVSLNRGTPINSTSNFIRDPHLILLFELYD